MHRLQLSSQYGRRYVFLSTGAWLWFLVATLPAGTQDPQAEKPVPAPSAAANDVSPAIRDSIHKFFDNLQTTFDKNNSIKKREYLALPEMAVIVRQQPKLAALQSDEAQLSKDLQRFWSTAMEAWQYEFYWSSHRITKIESLKQYEFVVNVRHHQAEDQLYIKLKWTLIQQPDSTWKISDIRDIEQDVAITTLLAVLVAAPENQPEWFAPTRLWLLTGGNHEFLDDELQPAVEILDKIDEILDAEPPTEFKAFFLTLKTSLLMMAEDLAQAGIELHNFEQLQGDHPIAHYFRAGLLMDKESYPDAIEQYRRYAELTGWDPDVCETVADCYWNSDNADQAIAFAVRGLEDQADAVGCLATLAIALPDERKPELEKWFQANKYDEDVLAYVIDWALTNDDQPTASYVFGFLEKHHPRSPSVKELRMLIDRGIELSLDVR